MEAHPDPHPGLGVIGLIGTDQVVELPVQMRHREHRQHPGYGFVRGGTTIRWAHGQCRERPKKKPAVMSICDAA